MSEPLFDASPLPRAQHGRVLDIPGDCNACRSLIRVLTTRPPRWRESQFDLRLGNRERAADPDPVHGRRSSTFKSSTVVTGALHVAWRQTYAAAFPSTGSLPTSNGMSTGRESEVAASKTLFGR